MIDYDKIYINFDEVIDFKFVDQVIYPGKVTDAETFRIGNIGHLFPEDLHHLIKCICEVLNDMKVPLPIVY